MGCGARIKEYISDHDIQQSALATQLGIPASTLSNYVTERTDLPSDLIPKIAMRLSVTTDYLLGLTEDPNPPFPVSAGERTLLTHLRSLTPEQRELAVQNVAFMVRQNSRKG